MPAPTPTPHDPQTAAPPAPRSLVVPMHRVLRVAAVAGVLALPVAGLLGSLYDGAAGAWGALIGMGLAMAFLGVTIAVALTTARTRNPTTLGIAVMASWLVKIIVLIGVLAFLRDQDFYSRPALFVSLLVGIAGTLVIEWRVVATTQVPYIEPDQR